MKKIAPGILAAAIGMSAAVALLMLFAASITRLVPISVLCLFVASLMTWIPLREERGYLFAGVEFAAVSLLSIAISRTSVYTWLYVLLFGHYAILRFFLRTHISDRISTVFIRFLVFNAMTAAGLAFAKYVMGVDLTLYLQGIPVFREIVIIEAVFAVFMLLYKLFALLFDSVFRNFLMPRR